MIYKERNGMKWLEFELLADTPVIHACFTRHGGVSKGPLASLNVGRSVGDTPENVATNFAKISEVLGLQTILPAKLTHGAEVAHLRSCSSISTVPFADALIIGETGIGVSISQADCQGAIIYDPVKHALANVHAGWRGSVKNIYKATVEAMRVSYGSKPEDLIVCISPSLGPESAEFVNYHTELPETFWAYQHRPYHFDFWEISKQQLREAGVRSDRIQIAEIDTKTDDDFFSFRRSRQTGRQATICALR